MDPQQKYFQVGVSIIFMKDELRQALDIEYSKAVYKHAVIIQKCLKGKTQYKKFKKYLLGAKLVQKAIKNWLYKRKFERNKKQLKLSCQVLLARKKINSYKRSVCTIRKFFISFNAKIHIRLQRNLRNNPILSEDAEEIVEDYKQKDDIKTTALDDIQEINKTEVENIPNYKRYEPKKSNFNKELTESNDLVIDTLNKEIANLGYLFSREREKNKTLQEEVLFYKNNYQTTLAQVQTLQSENRNFIITLAGGTKDQKIKPAEQTLQRELNGKNNEIELLLLKIKDLNQNLEESEEKNDILKKKENSWRNKFEKEIIKHSEEINLLKSQINASESYKSDPNLLEKELKSLKISNKSYESELLSLKNIVSNLESRNNDLIVEELQFKQQIKALQNEISSRNDNFSTINSEMLQKEITSSTYELQQIIDEQREENEELLEQLESLKIESNRMLSMENYYKQEHQKSKKQIKDNQTEIKELEKQIEDLHNEKILLTRSKIELESLQRVKKKDEENQEITGLKLQIEELNNEIEDMAHELENAKKLYSTLLSIINFKNVEINLYKQPNRSDNEFNRELGNIKQQEKELLEL